MAEQNMDLGLSQNITRVELQQKDGSWHVYDAPAGQKFEMVYPEEYPENPALPIYPRMFGVAYMGTTWVGFNHYKIEEERGGSVVCVWQSGSPLVVDLLAASPLARRVVGVSAASLSLQPESTATDRLTQSDCRVASLVVQTPAAQDIYRPPSPAEGFNVIGNPAQTQYSERYLIEYAGGVWAGFNRLESYELAPTSAGRTWCYLVLSEMVVYGPAYESYRVSHRPFPEEKAALAALSGLSNAVREVVVDRPGRKAVYAAPEGAAFELFYNRDPEKSPICHHGVMWQSPYLLFWEGKPWAGFNTIVSHDVDASKHGLHSRIVIHHFEELDASHTRFQRAENLKPSLGQMYYDQQQAKLREPKLNNAPIFNVSAGDPAESAVAAPPSLTPEAGQTPGPAGSDAPEQADAAGPARFGVDPDGWAAACSTVPEEAEEPGNVVRIGDYRKDSAEEPLTPEAALDAAALALREDRPQGVLVLMLYSKPEDSEGLGFRMWNGGLTLVEKIALMEIVKIKSIEGA